MSTVNDYMKFAEFLHTGCLPSGKRLIQQRTLNDMRQNHLKGIEKRGLAALFDGFGKCCLFSYSCFGAFSMFHLARGDTGLGVSCVVRVDPETGSPVPSLENPGGAHASEGTGGWSGA